VEGAGWGRGWGARVEVGGVTCAPDEMCANGACEHPDHRMGTWRGQSPIECVTCGARWAPRVWLQCMNGPLVNRMGREGQLEEACDDGRACTFTSRRCMRGQEVHAGGACSAHAPKLRFPMRVRTARVLS